MSLGFPVFLQEFLRIFNCLYTQVSIREFGLELSIQVLLFVFITSFCLFQLSIMNSFANIDLIMFALTMSE